MESQVKRKKRLKKPHQSDLTLLQTTVSSHIPRSPMSYIRPVRDQKTHSKSVHRCETPTKEEIAPKSSKRISSARIVRPKTRRDMASSSLNRLSSEECNPNKLKTFLKDDWRGKSPKFLEQQESYVSPRRPISESIRPSRNPTKERDRKLQVIVSSPIPSTPTSSVTIRPKKLSKSARGYQPKEENYRPVSFKRTTSVQIPPTTITKRDLTSFSYNRFGNLPSPKEYSPKRYSTRHLNDDDSGTSKVRVLRPSRKFVNNQESRASLTCKKPSKSSIMSGVKKPRRNYNKRLKEMLRTSTSKVDVKALRQDCHRIEMVFENRKRKEKTIRIENLNILGKLYLLICFGGVEEYKPQESVINYVTSYLCNNSYLLSQLVYIMADAEDLKTCLYTIKVLYQLLIKGWVIEDKHKSIVKSALSSPSMFAILSESMHTIHLRFSGNVEYKEEMLKIHSHILQMIIHICKSKSCRKQLRRVSDGTLKLISKLVCNCHRSKELANILLETVKIMCIKKKNCNVLASKKFFDGICTCYELTRKTFTVPTIFKIMSRVKAPLGHMSVNERVLNLILEMICYSGKKSYNKRALLATLYRISTDSHGLKLISKNEMFYKLFHYFRKDEEHKTATQRLGRIKAYTILNRAVKQVVLPNIELKRDLGLPEFVKKCLEEEHVSDESEPENDESEDDSDEEDDDDSDEMDGSCMDLNNIKILKPDYMRSDDLLTDMSPFFVEFLLGSEDTNYTSIFKFDVYEGIVRLTNKIVIENRIHRDTNNTRHAYPDALMLEPEYDEHVLNLSINHFSKESLCNKLKCLKGIQPITYMPRVIYDLDYLQDCNKHPPQVPHPGTFIPSKIFDRNQVSPTRALKFESRFECGNLRKAIQIESYEYELLLTPDTSTDKGLQWFYFQVSNMMPDIPYTFNIANFLKFNSQHNYGMQPLMFSILDYTIHKKGWQRVGKDIVYYGNNYTNESTNKQYRTLSFSVSFPYPNDFVYFAYHYPYTYTRLMIKLFPFTNYKSSDIYARIDKLCNTVKGRNEIALLTITGAWNNPHSLGIPLRRRPIIFITARVHPGETNASWIMEGVINFLLKQMDANAVAAREHFIFKIIPMLNPEGVIYGNSRNGLTGADLNRCWANPSKVTCPEIYYVKRLIACAKKKLKLPVAAYIDIHGHSRKKYFFFYGCNPKASWYKKDKSKGDSLDTLKLLPDMVREINPNIRLSQCKYKVTKNRESTGRVVMWRHFDIKHSYTLECSYSFASDKQSVNTKILNEVGSSVIASLGKLADKAYLGRKMVPSLGLDFSLGSTVSLTETNTCQEGNPMYVSSRALQHINTIPERMP